MVSTAALRTKRITMDHSLTSAARRRSVITVKREECNSKDAAKGHPLGWDEVFFHIWRGTSRIYNLINNRSCSSFQALRWVWEKDLDLAISQETCALCVWYVFWFQGICIGNFHCLGMETVTRKKQKAGWRWAQPPEQSWTTVCSKVEGKTPVAAEPLKLLKYLSCL